ncbi:uncharacterized protein GLRG_03869 [Colletotrichum graminicola M1.001]|uniref:Uncharacterized protein n=1 Tax=Colletotrichum graminicola (strain M1.001 / M2 / FGSC 10212) TaxID=645133 RepID=E3QCV3_COLGM|nr:uncharacterized protein GLRG_03869 [Colletotrichum graminicola M1.001]EFQ28725.1 hypothetical protein GLRG_03869 [Colletotrichum graminicola M1.001]
MKSAIFSLALATKLAAANPIEARQAPDAPAFTQAADALISAYIPEGQWSSLTSAFGSAASAAGVTGDVKSYVFSVLKATSTPDWFLAAIPTAYVSQYAALESAIESLRPTAAAATPVPTVIAVTTTDSEGNTITTSLSATITPVPTTITTDLVPTLSPSVITGTDSAGSAFTSTVLNTSNDGDTTATATVTETAATETETATGTASATESPEPTGTDASGTAPASTDAPNAAPTVMVNAFAGFAAIIGFVMAL